MPLLSSAIPNLVNGVSQQAASLRLSSQLEIQENAFSSIVEGLGKRSPSKHIARLATQDVSDAYFHLINRDSTERYKVVITDGDLMVYDLDGVAKTVAFPNGKEYLESDTPNSVMKALTVADYTFVLNTGIEAAMSDAVTTGNLGKALITIKQGQYGTRYTIKIDGDVVSEFITSDTLIDEIQTSFIAQALQTAMGSNNRVHVQSANWTESTKTLTQVGAFTTYTWAVDDVVEIVSGHGVIPGEYTIASKTSADAIVLTTSIARRPFTGSGNIVDNSVASAPIATDLSAEYEVQRNGSTLYIQKLDGTAIDIVVEDSFGNRALSVATEVVQRFSDLPVVAPAGFVTKVVGDTASATDDYYVKFVPLHEDQTFSNGNWIETIGPNVPTSIDATTMPHILVREADGTFTFKEATWTDREAGDATSNPDPSFIGSTIQDVFFFRGRLGLLSDENTILSVAGGFFSFFSQTVTTILDSDPVDVAASHTRVSLLKHAVPFNEELLLFSDQAQFVLSSSSLLTPSSATIDQSTEFEASLQARPVGVGNNIYFSFSRGAYSGVREYFVQKIDQTKDAADITAHVPKYIPGNITKLCASTNEDLLIALSSTDQAGFYLYKYYWLNDQKLQSSWSHYSFEEGSKVLSADFIESTLYLVVQRDDGYYLESMAFEPGQEDTDSSYVTALDRRLLESDVTAVYDSDFDTTTWTLPYEITSTMQMVVRSGDTDLLEGTILNLATQTGTTITALGDYSKTKVYIGQVYRMQVRLSQPVLHEESKGGGQSVISAGRLQIRNYTLVYDDSGYFVTEVTPTGRDTATKTFTGFVTGVDSTDAVHLSSGKFRFSVFAQSSEFIIDIISDSFLPCHFTGAEWEGFFASRSQRA